MPPIDQHTALAQHELFGHLEAAEREQLVLLGFGRRFNDGQMIFRRGDPGNSMMLVLRGQVKISIVSDEGKELIFAMTQPGECFGEIALLDGQPRSADATAVEDCVLFVLTRSDFIPFLEQHPRVAIHLLTVLCGRVRATSEFIERLAFQNLPARLARLLLKLAATQGSTTPVGIRITCKLSQQEIGNLLATSRESVNKQLRTWQAAGLLKIDRGAITLLQPTALNRLAHLS